MNMDKWLLLTAVYGGIFFIFGLTMPDADILEFVVAFIVGSLVLNQYDRERENK